MAKISKEYLCNAFRKRKRRRLYLLYLFYKEEYFSDKSLPADLVANCVSKDLGIEISIGTIYNINMRIRNPEINDKTSDVGKGSYSEKSNTSTTDLKEQKQKEEWVWEGPESYEDQLRKQAARYLKNPPKENDS